MSQICRLHTLCMTCAASVHVLSYAAFLPCLQSAGHVTHRNNAGALLAWCCAQRQQGSLRTGVISQMEDEDGHRLYPGRALAFTKSQLKLRLSHSCAMQRLSDCVVAASRSFENIHRPSS
jgi:hypothetical protein